jgi:hypothetical protein
MAERKHYHLDDDVKSHKTIEHINESFKKMELNESFEQKNSDG